MSRKNIAVFSVFAAVLVYLAVIAYADDTVKANKGKPKEDLFAQVELFSDAISLIRTDYAEEVNSKDLIYGALKGMLSSLDDFSEFLEPDEYKDMQAETTGEFGGVGIEISMRDGLLTIITPIASTPAEAAGIKALDRIVKIDNSSTKDMSIDDAIKLMRGEPGTKVTLTVWREKEDKSYDITIKRDIIKVTSIKKAVLLEGKTGYIKLVEFQENTPNDLEKALKDLEVQGMDSLILDLRNNPGGLLEVSVGVAEKFLPKDSVIVSIKARAPDQSAVFKSSGKSKHPEYPLIVLINEGSASASEIVAGSVQDNKRGLIMGARSFGKASVQTIIPLKDGSAIRLTTASYLTPGGKMIMKQGITPDVSVEKEDVAEKKKPQPEDVFNKLEEKKSESAEKAEAQESDNQVKAAINMIKGMKIYKTQEIPVIAKGNK